MSTHRLYIVSFGDSRQFRYEADVESEDAMHHADPFAAIEKELTDYLEEKFPGQTFAYFTMPKATEVDPSHKELFASYPELDAKAIADLKKELAREVEERDVLKLQNSNVPSSLFNSPDVP